MQILGINGKANATFDARTTYWYQVLPARVNILEIKCDVPTQDTFYEERLLEKNKFTLIHVKFFHDHHHSPRD